MQGHIWKKEKRQRRSAWETEWDWWEIETDFGCKGCSQNAAFQVRILCFFFFPSPAVSQAYDTGTRQAKIAVSVLYALDVGLNTHTIHKKIIIFFLMAASFSKLKLSLVLILWNGICLVYWMRTVCRILIVMGMSKTEVNLKRLLAAAPQQKNQAKLVHVNISLLFSSDCIS